MIEIKFLYRVENNQIWFTGEEPFVINKMFIISETEKTYLLERSRFLSEKQFGKRMYKNANNRYAFETKQEAIIDYIRRKKHHIKCLESNLQVAKLQLERAKLTFNQYKNENNQIKSKRL